MYTMEFSDFVKSLEKSTFENVVRRYCRMRYGDAYDEICVECCENTAYDDTDLARFLVELGAEITEYNEDHVIIKTEKNEIYKVAAENRTNRFGLDWPETVLFFNKIEKITDDIVKQLLHFKNQNKPLKYLVNYMYSMDEYGIRDVIEKMEEIGYDKQTTAECFAKDFGMISALNYNTNAAVEPNEKGKLDINCIPVVITYSFDAETPVLLFSSEDDAIKYIKKDFENEKRISVEENGYEIDENETYFNENDGYARLTIAGKAEEDVTEWRIGSIY